ncbi:MAG: 30S ribosomal protein S8 [Candidatus Cloacimonadota bacterium]|nr:30S ribosomal protein S8 [Candidatus Cloacimonadota bacterium]
MPTTDPIADMLTIIRNGIHAKKKTVTMNLSNMRKEIARILFEENFISKYTLLDKSEKTKRKFDQLRITIRYTENKGPVIKELKRVSRPGKRVYVNSNNIPVVYNHLGIAILSTNIGVITDSVARKERVGGEYLCKIW